jgi:glycogen debranching enzyme
MRHAIQWCERYGDLDGDGFLEYVTRSDGGIKNQGWKDSWDAVVDERGSVVPNPIAVCEVQGYWYAALRWAALAFFLAGDRAYALQLVAKARVFKRRFDQAFWMEDEGFYCMGLDPQKQQIRSIAANAGQLLVTGIVPKRRGWCVARRMMQPDMFSGWGVRTLSARHPAYNPFAYHLGSVWPVTQGTFALGFARYGCWDELHELAEGFFAATELFADSRLPEVLSGLPRDREHPHPGIYPSSNEPQGWSDSAVVLFVQALLGMIPVAPLGLLLVDPHLPPWLPSLRLEGVHVGAARVDLEFRRDRRGRSHFRATRREGAVRVIRQPPPEAPHAGPFARAAAALGTFPH